MEVMQRMDENAICIQTHKRQAISRSDMTFMNQGRLTRRRDRDRDKWTEKRSKGEQECAVDGDRMGGAAGREREDI